MPDECWYDRVTLPALLRHARTTYGAAMRRALAREGYDDIPGNGLYVIGGLALGDGGIPIGQLVRDLGITKQGAGQLVDTLVLRGYLARDPDPADRRQVIVTLTERGAAAAAVQAGVREEIDAALAGRIGEADVAAMRRGLGTLIEMERRKEEE
ncbi:MarR family transcriptional regulator [Sphingomonas naphthae]|uniref:MarR family transcriptional regulator n=1 Tax=Sphingomonas naphthae TaxID=1813468 RepID=A0ABY7TN10_9SPHN|nr:MarR family transcriptional regulator [Sphingomonas naphthae]WCT74393.1 MarR family transcriptional regulator [Sphingomonas naphthae]